MWRAETRGRALTSLHHRQYLLLDLDLRDRGFVNDDHDMSTISWIIKARGELIQLNYKPWDPDANYMCSLCNCRENETVFHFVAKCPILKDIRKRCLGSAELNHDDFVTFLNG